MSGSVCSMIAERHKIITKLDLCRNKNVIITRGSWDLDDVLKQTTLRSRSNFFK